VSYRLGASLELLVVERARADGALAFRCAGSKGEASTDVLIASRWTGILALNVKRGSWAPPAERVAMMRLERFGILPVLVRGYVTQGVRTVLEFLPCAGMALETKDVTTIAPWTQDWLLL
jgi:hypothetical protein